MKLQTRLFLTVSLIVTLCSLSIGSFSIYTNYQSQINTINNKLNEIYEGVSANQVDPLSEGLLRANESTLPIALTFYYENKLVNIKEAPGNFKKIPSSKSIAEAQIKTATSEQDDPVIYRAFKMPDGTYLLISSSIAELQNRVKLNLFELAIFMLIALTVALFSVFIFFRRDNEVNNLLLSLQQNQRKMQDFLGDASHELRTPLTVIRGYFELISRKDNTEEQKLTPYLSRIDVELNRMEKLISDLLLIAELSESNSELDEEISLSQMVSDQLTDLAALQPSRELISKIQPDIHIKSDRGLVGQLLANIFQNIRRHTPEDCLVEVELIRNQDKAFLRIEDSGPGLPEDAYENGLQFFERFDKSRNRTSGGAGLGMTIINRITQNIDANIRFSKGKHGGLCIEITFKKVI